jgi:hypothetical protein
MIAHIFLSFYLFLLHPLHLSVADIKHNPEAKSLEITQRLFADDLEDALRHQSGAKVDVLNPADHAHLSGLIGRYLQQNFQLQLNGKQEEAKYLGHEIEGDAVWVYMEVPNVRGLKSISVQNTVFFEMFDDQINLINVDKDGKIRSLKLSASQKRDQLNY